MINNITQPLDEDIRAAADRCAANGIELTVTFDGNHGVIIFRYRKGDYGLIDLIRPIEFNFPKVEAKEVINFHVNKCIKRINEVTKGE